jgi:lactoylglutathione lyase
LKGTRLNLLVLRCTDLERSREFYEALGLAFAAEQHGSGPNHYSANLGGLVLELYPSSQAATPIRIGVAVADVQAVVNAVRGFADCVVQLQSAQRPHSALIVDPDGNKIELSALSD